MKVTTNNRARPLLTFNELPEAVKSDFDYTKLKDQPFFVKVGKDYYDAFDVQEVKVGTSKLDRPVGWAMYVEDTHPFAKWNGVTSESAWSGVLFRYVDDGVVVGKYTS